MKPIWQKGNQYDLQSAAGAPHNLKEMKEFQPQRHPPLYPSNISFSSSWILSCSWLAQYTVNYFEAAEKEAAERRLEQAMGY